MSPVFSLMQNSLIREYPDGQIRWVTCRVRANAGGARITAAVAATSKSFALLLTVFLLVTEQPGHNALPSGIQKIEFHRLSFHHGCVRTSARHRSIISF